MSDAPAAPAVPASTYQLLRDRLRSVAADLRTAADRLNADRTTVFAAVPLALAEQDRLHTEQPTLPRDVVSVDDSLLFGFNAGAALGRPRQVEDAFAMFSVDRASASDWSFQPIHADDGRSILGDAGFRRDLGELFTYYADTRLIGLRRTVDRLLMVFSVGSSDDDVRVLRWQFDAADPSAPPTYLDAYGDDDLTSVQPYDFEWRPASRETLVEGRWRHYAIEGLVFVGIDRQRLEFRVDDVVSGGRTVLAEPLAAEQSIDELRLGFAVLGDVVVLRVAPYREDHERFYVFNRLTRAVVRADALGRNCHQLPEGQGIVFPGGYHLQNGETKVFSLPGDTGSGVATFRFHASHRSPNGEDILYVYHRRDNGEYLLCHYSVVTRSMASPILTDGYALFDDGTIVSIRHAEEPQRVHAVNVYTSPFCTPDRYRPDVAGDSFHGRIGNAELVRVLGEALSLATDAADPDFNAAVFEALVSRSTLVLDAYPWVHDDAAHGLGASLVAIRKTAGDVLDEFAAVVAAKQEAAGRLSDTDRRVADLAADAELELRDTATYIDRLAAARALIGELVTLADVREIDLDEVGRLRARVEGIHEALGRRAVEFLAEPAALGELFDRFDATEAAIPDLASTAAVAERIADVEQTGERVVMLTEVVGGLTVTDPTVKTAVLTRLSDALARRNGVRAALDARADVLRTSELAASFQASLSVIGQRSQAALMAAADAAACDAALATLVAELENAELEFGVVDEYATAIAARRDEIVGAFTQRREFLAAERSRRIDRMVRSTERVLATIDTRASALADRVTVDTFFSTDPLVAKVRESIAALTALGEAGRAGELDVALTTTRDHARRAVADRADLFDAGTVRIGRWRFGVNTEPFELRLDVSATGADDTGAVTGAETGALVNDRGAPSTTFRVRLTGTDLVIPVASDALGEYADLADRVHPTETPSLARAVYLAFDALTAGIASDGVAAFAARRIDDGYEPGVHDADAARLVDALQSWWAAPSERLPGVVRGLAGAWLAAHEPRARAELVRRCAGIAALPPGRSRDAFHASVEPALADLARSTGLAEQFDPALAADWLIDHAADGVVDETAITVADRVRTWATDAAIDLRSATIGDLVRWADDLCDVDTAPRRRADIAAQAAWRLLDDGIRAIPARLPVTVDGLRGTHPTVRTGAITIDPAAAHLDYVRHRRDGIERFRAFADRRRRLLADHRAEIGLDRLRPQVISSFVRNRLIDEVYLPLFGDNLAKQMGLNGAAQGLLLLLSPPGYGKTTLLEYLADLLGFAMVKINGPALGTGVTSLDPGAAPDQAAAAELVKLNRAFAMGNNVLVVVDDIQHTSPEFLQKFIPLCDATRRIEGVVDGVARTFSLSGKRFVIAMAGNPYTSSGEMFRIPDMLANRSDVHNLGEMAASAADAFAQSYIENACGVNEVLAPVLGRSRRDVERLLGAATGAPLRSDELEHTYAASELTRITATLGHLVRVRSTLLLVNAAYIRSATMDDAMRGEPAFLLQGSYRNMARIAQRVLPAMTAAEVDGLVADHYQIESQTLAAAAGWNLAKLGDVLGTATPAELAELGVLRDRWKEANVHGDPMAVIANALTDIADALRPPSGT